jgi:hypothetical protein
MNKTEIEATEKLADAMSKLADSIKDLQDPVRWQKILQDAARTLAPISDTLINAHPVPGAVGQAIGASIPPIFPVAVEVKLSDEEREKMIAKVSEELKPQLSEFKTFVDNALRKMPAHRLKGIADKIDQGVKPKLSQRPGCIFIEADGEDAYLGL